MSAAFGAVGCAVAPLERAADATADRVMERTAVQPVWPPAEGGTHAAPELREPVTLPSALALAFTRNPDIRRQYARLGIAHADLQEAARIANPRLSLAWLDPSNGARDQTTRAISASFADLLLLPARRRLSAVEFQRVELAVAASLVSLAHEVETAWYSHVGALQVATMRDAVAIAAESEATLAQRFHEAGNIGRLELDLRQTAAARARIEALRARSGAAGSRTRLANLLGLQAGTVWQTAERLPAPPETLLSRDELVQRALSQRLDLAAVREEVTMLEDALGVTKSWRLLGLVEAGYKRERETDGSRLRGLTLNLELPLFNQGQGAVARAETRLLDAVARREALSLAVENEVTAGIEQLELAREIAGRYRDALLPGAASVVARRQEEVNFMLRSVFELLQARRNEYDAWQAYLESVRNYWIAWTDLRAATGGSLPGDGEARPLTIGVDEIIAPAAEAAEPEESEPAHHRELP
ncbi:MAG TPA: TolC family protein [Steroidobacteraceae bacterium]|nr:TolC family protein [Steroidobacteraceae bacterium]